MTTHKMTFQKKMNGKKKGGIVKTQHHESLK